MRQQARKDKALLEQVGAGVAGHLSIVAQQNVLDVESITPAAKEALRKAKGEATPEEIKKGGCLAAAAGAKQGGLAAAAVEAQTAVAAAKQQEKYAAGVQRNARLFKEQGFNNVNDLMDAILDECPRPQQNQSIQSCISHFFDGTMKPHVHPQHNRHISGGIASNSQTGTSKSCTIFSRDLQDGGFEIVGIGRHTGNEGSKKRYTLDFYMHPTVTSKIVLL